MGKKPEPAQLIRWDIYRAAAKGKLLGIVEATDLKNSEVVRGFADALSVAPRTYSRCHGDANFVVFCFAEPEDAKAFCEQFGGEQLPGDGRPSSPPKIETPPDVFGFAGRDMGAADASHAISAST